jgi:hypothetical protein
MWRRCVCERVDEQAFEIARDPVNAVVPHAGIVTRTDITPTSAPAIPMLPCTECRTH